MVNSTIQEEKYKYVLPVYNLRHLDIAPDDDDVNFTVNDGQFFGIAIITNKG